MKKENTRHIKSDGETAMTDIYSITRQQMKPSAEEEIFETWTQIEEQDEKWKVEINKIMKQVGIDYYPERQHFIMTGNKTLYKEISDFATHGYVATILNIETAMESRMREAIFDVMFKCKINFMPEEEHFRCAKTTGMYQVIKRTSSLEEQRKRLKLLTKSEYEKLVGRTWKRFKK
jgi:SHS2 domain-containing protein